MASDDIRMKSDHNGTTESPDSVSEPESIVMTTATATSSPSTRTSSGSNAFDGSVALQVGSRVDELEKLFSENILAKLYRTATKYSNQQRNKSINASQCSIYLDCRGPDMFPEYVPQDGDEAGQYVLREGEFWTCGFFPGTLYLQLERLVRFPQCNYSSPSSSIGLDITAIRDAFKTLCGHWAQPLYAMADRKDTHDIGFIIMPALQLDWELTGNPRSLGAIVEAAESLASRFVSSSGAIRSWDLLKKKNFEILDMDENLIIIIDSLCNLDLLYYAASHSGLTNLYNIATTHAAKLLETHLRPEIVKEEGYCPSYSGKWYSTCHVAVLDPKTGTLKRRLTHQGYVDDSTWARGQSWGILGYAQTYMWTKDQRFLEAASGLAEYFLHSLRLTPSTIGLARWDDSIRRDAERDNHNAPQSRRYHFVPSWDFDAPQEESRPTLDSSAGVIAANGMLILSQALAAQDMDELSSWFRRAAVAIVRDTLDVALAPEKAKLFVDSIGNLVVDDVTRGETFEGILKYGTANNNANARKQYANHGLAYGDYYLVEFGNRLLRMGLV